MDSVALLGELCESFPHRGMGSSNERKAAVWIAEKLRAMGYQTEEEPFQTTIDNLYLMPAQVFACAAVAAAMSLFTPLAWFALAVLVYGLAILVVEVSGYPFSIGPPYGLAILVAEISGYLSLFPFPRVPSRNVLTERRAEAPRTVFVTAHYDTQRGSYLFHPRFVDHLQPFFYVCYGGVLLALAGVVLKLSGAQAAVYALWPGLGICVFAFAAFVLAEVTGRYTPGANDNGTGVALALWLASDYAARRGEYPTDCELRFLFTGCEEAGERGMKAFLQAHRGELDPRRTMFVNLDNLGAGELTYLTGEGMLFYRKAGPTLLRIARQMEGTRERKNLLLPTDALPASTLGFEAISFLGMGEKGRLGNYHWHTDTFENVDPEFLRFQQGFFREYLMRAMAAGGQT